MKQLSLVVMTLIIASAFVNRKPFAYTLSAIDPATARIKAKLEQSSAVLQTKGKTSPTSSTYNTAGTKSAVRLKISEAIFQSVSDQLTGRMNPADYISLYKVTVGKNNRSFVINNDGTANAALIPVTFSSMDVLYYRILPANGLVPGEYAFIDKSTTTSEGNLTIWTFGID